MKNLDVRILVSESGLTYKEIAKQIGITREWLSKLMRDNLSTENKIRIMNAIEKAKKEKEQCFGR